MRVLRGPRAQGKTALLARFRDRCGLTTLCAAGGPGEAEQPYGLVQQLLEHLFGAGDLVRELDSPERVDLPLMCRRVFRVLRDLAAEQPVLVLVDDAHYADAESARVLSHVARRAGGHAFGVVLTAGGPLRAELDALPDIEIPGFDEEGLRELLSARGATGADSVLTALVRTCRGNPLVIAEFVGSLSEAQLSGRAPLPCEPVLGAESLRVFGAIWSGLGESARRWLHVLALGPELVVATRAAEALGLALDDLAPAERAGLVHTRLDRGVHWPVPWVRESVVQSATLVESARVCAALAEATPPDRYPAEHARYLAGALSDPEQAAGALAAASVPMARAGMLVRAYEAMTRAGELTTSGAERERYRIITAELAWLAGYSDHALDLLDRSSSTERGADTRTSEVIVRSVIHGFRDSWSTGWRMLPLEPAYQPGSAGHAIRLLVTALTAGWESTSRESLLRTVARLRDLADAGEGVVPGVVRPLERLIAGSSEPGERGRHALRALAWWAQPSDALHPKAWPPRLVPVFLGEEEVYADIFAELLRTEHVQAARSTRAALLLKLATARTALGQWDQAVESAEQGARLAGELGHHALHADLQLALGWIAAARGDERACVAHVESAAAHGGESTAQSSMEHWVRGLLALSLGRPLEAFERLRELHRGPPTTPHVFVLRRMATMDTVEAAVLAGHHGAATELVSEFAGWIRAGAAGWAWADLARCRALLEDAERWHRLALDRGGRGWSGARARLVYGFWLRRRRRDQDARAHLRAAEEEFARLGAGSWRQRAHAELRATGETQPERGGSPDALTPQERQIAELAAAGHTNRQIAAKLALSPRTVGYHLYKVFPKLDITSRTQLAAALRAGESGVDG